MNVAEKEHKMPDYKLSEELTQEVIKIINSKFMNSIPGVEDVQNIVVKVLIEGGHARLVKNIYL